MRLKIYVAGQITGLTLPEIQSYFNTTGDKLRAWNYRVFLPLTDAEALKNGFTSDEVFKSSGYKGNPLTEDKAIFRRDIWMVRQADIVLCNLNTKNNHVSIGCTVEIAHAHAYGKHVVTVIDNTDNPHHHAFILQCSDVVFPTLDEALEYLKDYSSDIDIRK